MPVLPFVSSSGVGSRYRAESLLLPLPNRRVFLRSTCDRTQRHCTGEIQSNYEINKPVMKVESGFLSFVRKLESANVNFPDGDL
jgi:hypothetical protein